MPKLNAASLEQLHQELGFKPLNPLWAKCEIFLGLFAIAMAFVSGAKLAALPEAEFPWWAWLGPVLLFTFGGYLALAGHRSHLYQSNNRLAAHLADLIRKNTPPRESLP